MPVGFAAVGAGACALSLQARPRADEKCARGDWTMGSEDRREEGLGAAGVQRERQGGQKPQRGPGRNSADYFSEAGSGAGARRSGAVDQPFIASTPPMISDNSVVI